jgi:hypothetical protein
MARGITATGGTTTVTGGSTVTSGTMTLQNEGDGRQDEVARRSTLY